MPKIDDGNVPVKFAAFKLVIEPPFNAAYVPVKLAAFNDVNAVPTKDGRVPGEAMLAAVKADKLAPFPLKLVAVKAPVTVAPVLLVSNF